MRLDSQPNPADVVRICPLCPNTKDIGERAVKAGYDWESHGEARQAWSGTDGLVEARPGEARHGSAGVARKVAFGIIAGRRGLAG
jgi:hypothetical protein